MNIANKTTSYNAVCFHCNLETTLKDIISYDNHNFCCSGCQMVYKILSEHKLCDYYQLNDASGNKPDENITVPFAHLDNEIALSKFLLFQDSSQNIIELSLPHMHCSSCIWLLEKLHKINPAILHAKVDFLNKKIKITYLSKQIKLSEIVALCHQLGYPADLNLNSLRKNNSFNKSLVLKIGVAGFCFGNIMLLNFPEYLDITFSSVSPLLAHWFAYIALFLSLPVLLYSASDFFISGFKALKNKSLNIDLPIAIAILATFIRSVYDIYMQNGTGFLDTMSGIVLLMLVGRWFQDYTYKNIQFEHSVKNYFPLFVSKVEQNTIKSVQVETLMPGNTILLRHGEVLPTDALVKSHNAQLDLSFITGESEIINSKKEAYVYAGAKISGHSCEFVVVKPVSRKYLEEIWESEEDKLNFNRENNYTEQISKYFSLAIIIIAFLGGGYWFFIDKTITFNVFTAVLIVACPCTLLLATTLTYGHAMRYLGRAGLYLKHHTVLNKLRTIDYIVFDKTGTLTNSKKLVPIYKMGNPDDLKLIASLANQSNHPISVALTKLSSTFFEVSSFKQIEGKGIRGLVNDKFIEIGSATFLKYPIHQQNENAAVYIKINSKPAGYFLLQHALREGVLAMLKQLKNRIQCALLSGDNDASKAYFAPIFKSVLYNQTPEQKEGEIMALEKKGKHTLMIGDGLNDAAALKAAHCGLALAENEYCFFPSCDGLITARHITHIPSYIAFANKARNIIFYSFCVSLAYNIIGISIALTNNLSPLAAAVIMPTCSVSIILANWLFVRYYYGKLFIKE